MLICVIGIQTAAMAGQDKQISMKQLPVKAQKFLAEHFADSKTAIIKMDKELFDTTYDVIFTNGNKIEFDKQGEWKDIECKYSRIPENVIPKAIRDHIKMNQPELYILEIDRDKRDYEIKLNNGLEIKFDLKFNPIGYDN